MKNSKTKIGLIVLVLIITLSFVSCKQETKVTPVEAKAIAEEAYIFAYPMVMNYRSHYLVGLNEASPFFKAPYNKIVSDTEPADHTRHDVVTMNADTPYTLFGLDLNAEPVVVSVPDVPDRYYVFQFIDMYTHNFAYIGTRTTGNKAGHYLFVGPKWKEEIPKGKFNKVFHCESNYVGVTGRTQIKNLADLPNVVAIQKGYKVAPLSIFLGKPAKPAKVVDWPVWKPEVMTSLDFFSYLNFLLPFSQPFHPEDQRLMKRFARIGIAPGKPFDADKLDPAIRTAMEQGMKSGDQKISEKTNEMGKEVNGWVMADAAGPREFYKGDWLLRAAAAMSAMYMNDRIEASYAMGYKDADGKTLDGKTGKYTLSFEKGKLPPANYFWSVTMYDKSVDGTGGYLIKNPIDRYLINSITEGLVYGEDGSLTIYLQHEQPDGEKAANWLPAPAEPFYMQMRIYGPQELVLNDEWEPPPVQKVE